MCDNAIVFSLITLFLPKGKFVSQWDKDFVSYVRNKNTSVKRTIHV